MKDLYSKYIADYSWLIKEDGWVKSLQGIREAQLSLGNGFIGSRAILEELPYDAKPGTYIAGFYDNIGSRVDELINLPNPFNFKITANGEKLGIGTMDVEKHRRILDLKHGLLIRHSEFKDTDKRRYDYQSIRFTSMHSKNIGVMQIIFTPLDDNADISIQTGIDTNVYNVATATEGRKRHLRIKELGQIKNAGFLIGETYNKQHTVIFRSGLYYETKNKKIFAEDNIFEMKLHKNQTIVLTKIFYIDFISKNGSLNKLKEVSEKRFRKTFQANFKSLLRKHTLSWKNLWNLAEVSVWGAPEIEKSFRFNVYHMLICARNDKGFSSIGAKALTGEGYRGHIFWDAEIFLFPFYLYTFPDIAKNMLLYRHRRLDKAREIAKTNGFNGAMFPWESAGSGGEETPDRAKDLDGKIIKIHTGCREHHITADIAYAYYCYYNATQDEEFLKDYGYEIFFETARFWASRVEYSARKGKYEIKNVIGPDEFHENVDNNTYTNMMAKWNLFIAHRMFQKLKKTDSKNYKRLEKKINISDKESKKWKSIANRIVSKKNKNQIIEQFEGYFRKTKIKITGWDENHIPNVPKRLTPRDYTKTQLIKQGDVVLLMHLLPHLFSSVVRKKNYSYYVERTIHRSSLSLPIYAISACDAKDKDRAYRFFNAALQTDINNLHKNTADGIHSACMGGVWQALINGFVGVKIEKSILSIDPKLPVAWRKVLFTLCWRQRMIRFEVKNDKIEIQIIPSNGKTRSKIKIKVFDVMYELSINKKYTFTRKKSLKQEPAYYL